MGNNKKIALNEATNSPQNSKLRRKVGSFFNSNNPTGKSGTYNNHKNHFLYSTTVIVSTGVQTDIPYCKTREAMKKKSFENSASEGEREQKLLKSYRAFESKSDKRKHYLKLLKQ